MSKRCAKEFKREFTGWYKAMTHENFDKANSTTINKIYAEYNLCELNEKSKKTVKALDVEVCN